jgi:sugar/nucleoside kinase (ribokinase family)
VAAPLVVVIGDALLDVHVDPSEPMRPGGDVPASIRMVPGGQGANVAVRLARRGVRVRLVCAVGPDAAGRLLREALAADGVDLDEIDAPHSGATVVLRDASGDRTMLSQRVPVLGHGLDASPVADAGWLAVSGYVLLERGARIPTSGDSARRVVLGCSVGPRQSADWMAAARSVGPHLVILNLDEARALAGEASAAPPHLAAVLGDRLGSVAVVTHAGGSAAAVGGDTFEVTAPPSAPAVDTTGAGDAFAAMLIAGLLDAAWPPGRGALRRAVLDASTLATAVAGVAGAQGRVAGEHGASLMP